MKSYSIAFAALAAALALAACNTNSNPSLGPTPGPACVLPSGTQSVLVDPAPNATAGPDAFGQIVIGSTAALPSSWDAVVTSSALLSPYYGGKVAAATPPFPTPNATPSFANPVYQSSSFSNLGPLQGTVVKVYLNDTSSNCTPYGPIGQFTTQ